MTTIDYQRLFVLIAILVPGAASAQTPIPGTCSRPLATAVLDYNNVRAELFQAGILRYEIPAGSGRSAIETTDIWFGGLVDGELRVAGKRWGSWEFWPGPLNPGATLPDPNDCSAYDRMFEVTADDLEQYGLYGILSADLEEWPWDLGAPVVDGDGLTGNYDLKAGDRPELIGQQRIWWIMNDVGNEHRETRSDPLGIEVHGSAAAARDAHDAINNTTIYSYRVINRLTVPIDSMFMGVYSQAHLGGFYETFIGVDTTIGMSFAYNSVDEHHEYYGGPPPAFGMVLIKGWPSASDEMDNDYDGEVDEPGEEAGLSHFMWWGGDEDILRAQAKYNMMTGFFRYGEPLTYGGRGWGGTTRTRFHFPGDPVTGAYWSEMNIDSMGTALSNARPGSVSSFGPFHLEPGAYAEFTFAYVWAQGKDNLDSITKLRRDASAIQSTYDELYLTQPPYRPPIGGPPGEKPVALQNFMLRPHPNPATDYVMVSYTVQETAAVRIEFFDVLGRSAKVVVNELTMPGAYFERVPVLDLAPGVYLYRASIGREAATGTLVIAR